MKSILIFLMAAFKITPSLAAEAINLHYNTRPPYVELKDGELVGLTASPTVKAFKSAEISFKQSEMPAVRFLEIIKLNAEPTCGINWFKNPERETFGKYTKAVYRDSGLIALAAKSNNKIPNTVTMAKLLGNTKLTLLMKKGYSYGSKIDSLFEQFKPKMHTVVGESDSMIKVIKSGRADYLLIGPEEVDALLALANLSNNDIKRVKISDAPPGEFRYIFCSKSVPDEVINSLNSKIQEP